jgi:hypothetical protein
MVEKGILLHSQSCVSPEDHGLFHRLAASHISNERLKTYFAVWDFKAGNLTFWYVTEMNEPSLNSILAGWRSEQASLDLRHLWQSFLQSKVSFDPYSLSETRSSEAFAVG